jgi:hypothetical protein
MRFALHPAVRRVLVIGVAAATAAASVFRGGIFTNVFLELGVIVFVYNLPYLLNRAQHIHLSRSTPLLVDLENGVVRDASELRCISYNLFMRPGIMWIRNNESDYKDVRLEAFLRHLEFLFFFIFFIFVVL